MKKLATIFLLFVTLLAIMVSVNGFVATPNTPGQVFQILFIPITVFLFVNLASHLVLRVPVFETRNKLTKIISLYCLVISAVFVLAGFLSSASQNDFISALIFSPLVVFFLIMLWPERSIAPIKTPERRNYAPVAPAAVDASRRDFLKLIGTAGISIFLYNLIFRRDVSPLFGNIPGNSSPLALQNAQGEVINPAEKSPTEGYSISQVDDSTATAYFGFVNKLGQWFIMRQDSTDSYRYSRGDNDFTSGWSSRAELNYDYFDNVF